MFILTVNGNNLFFIYSNFHRRRKYNILSYERDFDRKLFFFFFVEQIAYLYGKFLMEPICLEPTKKLKFGVKRSPEDDFCCGCIQMSNIFHLDSFFNNQGIDEHFSVSQKTILAKDLFSNCCVLYRIHYACSISNNYYYRTRNAR